MHVVANLERLQAEGLITAEAAQIMKARSRETMVGLGINTILCGGIIAATAGLIFYLGTAMSVAVTGVVFFVLGAVVLNGAGTTYRMFGNAAALIGAGMLIGGAGLELADKLPDQAGTIMVALGGLLAMGTAALVGIVPPHMRFATRAIFLMSVALHLAGIGVHLTHFEVNGPVISLAYLYSTVVLVVSGWFVDVRLVTALAIVPFAQMLDTGTAYFHAMYVFYSPESTLTILQMTLLIVVAYWLAHHSAERTARHAGILAIMGFIVANLCALVGSLWGDRVGEYLLGPKRYEFETGADWREAHTAFAETTLFIPDWAYSIGWAVVLIALIFYAAHRNMRGLFNASLVFAGIHAYTQAFETFHDEPLAYVIGGLAAIPLAWSLWRMNQWLAAKESQPA